MPRVHFTPHLQRYLSCPPREVAGRTLAEVLQAVFSANPPLRGYVLDDQGAVRPNVAIFLDGEQIKDRERLSDPVPAGGEVYVLQALSGG